MKSSTWISGSFLDFLNQAYASEWLAYYQYWLGAKLIKGPMKDAVAAELNLHATEDESRRPRRAFSMEVRPEPSRSHQ